MARSETQVSQQRIEARGLDHDHRGGKRESVCRAEAERLVKHGVVEDLTGALTIVEPKAMKKAARRRETTQREHAPVVVVEAAVADVHGAHQKREQTQPEPAGDEFA